MENNSLKMHSSSFKYIKALLSLVLSCVLIGILAREVSPSLILTYMSNLSALGLASFTILSVLGLLLRAYRFKLFLRSPSYGNQKIGLHIIQALAIRNFIMEFFPFRIGETSILAYLSFIKIKLTESTRALLACMFLDIISLLIFIAFALLGFFFAPSLPQSSNNYLAVLLVISLLFLTISLLAYWAVYNIRQVGEFLSNKFGSYFNELQRLVPKSLKRFRPFRGAKTTLMLLRKTSKAIWIRGLIVSLTLRIFKYLSLSILFIDAIGHDSRFYEAIIYHTLLLPICFITSEAVASLPASGLFGFGGYELSFDYSYSLLFSRIENLTSIVFGIHLVSQVVNLLTLGTVFLLSSVPAIRRKIVGFVKF